MDLPLSDEQRQLQDSVARLLAQQGGAKRARSLRGKAAGFERVVHAKMAGEGWFAILVPQEHGGLGLSPIEAALVLMEVGRALAPEPIAASMLAAWAVAHSPIGSIRDELLPSITSGQALIVPAFDADRAGEPRVGAPVRARATEGTIRLDGITGHAPHAAHADGFLIEAQSVLCYVPRAASGLAIATARTVDGRDHGCLELTDVQARQVLAAGELDPLFDLALVMSAAELVGVMSAALDMTLDYLKTRTQFGKPIGSFQALQHRAVDDFTRIVSSRSLLWQVASQGDAMSPALASALKAHASGEALKVTKSAIQMHGGIGFTDEHDIGLYLKRAMWLSAYLGNEAVHRKRYAQHVDADA